ncbi:MAG: hypothetical protein ACLP9L_10845 [Thermoguttaceae bacterium]
MYNLMNNLMKLFLSIWLLSAVTLTAAEQKPEPKAAAEAWAASQQTYHAWLEARGLKDHECHGYSGHGGYGGHGGHGGHK